MDDVNYILLVSRWLHLSAAVIAIGGAVFTRVVLIPGANAALTDEEHERLRRIVRARWARIVYVCMGLLVVSGLLNFVLLVLTPKIEPMPYHAIFSLKLMASIGVFLIAAALAGSAPAFAKMRQAGARWLSVLLVLAALIILVSGLLNQIRSANAARQSVTPTSVG